MIKKKKERYWNTYMKTLFKHLISNVLFVAILDLNDQKMKK